MCARKIIGLTACYAQFCMRTRLKCETDLASHIHLHLSLHRVGILRAAASRLNGTHSLRQNAPSNVGCDWLTATHVAYGLGNFSEQVLFVFYGCASKVTVSRCDIFQAGDHARAHFIPCACHFLPSWRGTKILRRMSSGTSANSSHLHLARPQQPQTRTNIIILYISNEMTDNAWREISWVMKYVAKPVSNTGTTMRMKGLCRVGVSAH